MRLTRRPPGLPAVTWAALSLLALGILMLVLSWVRIFAGA
jgi:hypothetical protein